MGQIIGSAAKPKRCNLNKLSQLGTPASGEYILVSSDNSMNASGQGNFDSYIIGDGSHAATALELHYLADIYPVAGGKNPASSGSVYDLQIGIIHPQYTMTTGAITPNGSIGSSTSYSYSSPIALKKGQKISVYSQGYGYAAVSEYDGSTYTPLVSVVDNPGTGVYVTSEYVAQNDMSVVVCVRSANAYDVYLDGGVKMLERQLDEIVNGKLIKITPVESSVTECRLVASGTQSVIQYISNGNYRVAFFPVESGKSYKIHVASTRNGRAWGWCDSYISAAPSSSTNLGGLVSPTTTSNGSVYDEVVTNDGGYSYICIPFTYNAGGRTLEEIISGDVVTYKVQGKTSEEKAVARQNIGAASGSDMSQVLGRMLNNYLEGKGQTYVYKQIHGLAGGRTYRVVLKSNNWDISGITGDDNYKFLIRNDYNGSYTLLVGKYLPDTLDKYYDITLPANSDYITIGGRAVEGVLIEFDIIDYTDILRSADTNLETIIFSINHRGYSLVAPENTLPAFILSRKMGFSYVETDVAFTSDNVAVLMHDATINRTARNSDGSQLSSDVYIYDITYAQALQYDYGIWKGSEWAGTPIPTFKEFIQCCKEMSLHPFIELKNSIEWTQARCEAIAEDIKAVGMERNVSFISFDENALAYMSAIFPDAMIGLGYQGVYNTQNLTAFLQTAASLKTSTNKVLVSLRYSDMTSSLYDLVSAAGVNSIVWTVNSATDATNLDDNTIGVLSDSLNAGKLIIEKNYQTLPI